MSLDEEIATASKTVIKDGYDMSVGELMSLYRDKELVINPKYQRYFRWDGSQKTKFIESLLLGIPIPPIFVYTAGRKWEVIDGLQRLSTLLEFAGILRDFSDPAQVKLLPPSTLEGTQFLPSLADKRWDESADGAGDGFTDDLKFELKRVRIRVEILKKGSDPLAKFELFQRLNSGGSALSEQELRSCVIVMINEGFHDWAVSLSDDPSFAETTNPTERAVKSQKDLEWVIRYLAFRNVPYKGKGQDVHDYLDAAAMQMASDPQFDRVGEGDVFRRTFTLLKKSLGPEVFKPWDGTRFKGQTSLSAFEFISHGVSRQIDRIEAIGDESQTMIAAKVKALWSDPKFSEYAKAGVRGTTRLSHLLPLAQDYFRP